MTKKIRTNKDDGHNENVEGYIDKHGNWFMP